MFAIGEASRQSGVGIETIRYYEREGIVPKPERAPNNRRMVVTRSLQLAHSQGTYRRP